MEKADVLLWKRGLGEHYSGSGCDELSEIHFVLVNIKSIRSYCCMCDGTNRCGAGGT